MGRVALLLLLLLNLGCLPSAAPALQNTALFLVQLSAPSLFAWGAFSSIGRQIGALQFGTGVRADFYFGF